MKELHDLSFASPWAFLLLGVVAALIAERLLAYRSEREAAFRFSSTAILEGLPVTFAARFFWLPDACRVLSLVAFVCAVARPQLVGAPRAEEEEGIDIVLAIDTSCSMMAADFQPQDRMFVAKKSIQEFILKRKTDRIALVVFAGEAATWVPLTLDYSLVAEMMQEVSVGMVSDGTAIGNAIGIALNRLKESEAHSKVVVLLTDGDNNAGEISPKAAAELAKDLGIRIYTILIGTGGAVPFPAGKDLFGRPVFRKQVIPTNPELLEDIARTTGAEAFTATDKTELDARLGTVLDRLDKSKVESSNELRPYAELFPWFVLAGLVALALEGLLRATRFRRYP
ncbi:MAG: VWA domain-containing protein [Myxococcota bacterium]